MTESTNIGQRILQILKEKGITRTPFEEEHDISRGYLKRAAEKGTGIGSEIVEKILLKYEDVDAYWLITGKKLSRNTYEKPTPAINTSQIMDIKELQRELAEVREILDQTDELRIKYMKECARLKVEKDSLAEKNQTLRERLIKAGITDVE